MRDPLSRGLPHPHGKEDRSDLEGSGAGSELRKEKKNCGGAGMRDEGLRVRWRSWRLALAGKWPRGRGRDGRGAGGPGRLDEHDEDEDDEDEDDEDD